MDKFHVASQLLDQIKFNCNMEAGEEDCGQTAKVRDHLRPYLEELTDVVAGMAHGTRKIFELCLGDWFWAFLCLRLLSVKPVIGLGRLKLFKVWHHFFLVCHHSPARQDMRRNLAGKFFSREAWEGKLEEIEFPSLGPFHLDSQDNNPPTPLDNKFSTFNNN